MIGNQSLKTKLKQENNFPVLPRICSFRIYIQFLWEILDLEMFELKDGIAILGQILVKIGNSSFWAIKPEPDI